MALNGFALRLGSEGYPDQLAEVDHPPQTLYGIGDAACLRPGLAVIGARRATPCGLAVTRTLAGWAAAAGYVVYSGAAIGCDQAAHRAALDHGGHTVAVLGSGPDVAYPRGARALLDETAAAGAVVSEHPWGTQPQRWMFRTRNRIIAGLCRVLLVVEARIPSGTFSTVEYAIDAARVVAAVPGSVLAPECSGPNRVLRDGGHVIADVEDLQVLLTAELGPPKGHFAAGSMIRADSDDPLLSALRTNPMRPDQAAALLGLDAVETVRRVGTLEISGLISRYPDGRYGPC